MAESWQKMAEDSRERYGAVTDTDNKKKVYFIINRR